MPFQRRMVPTLPTAYMLLASLPQIEVRVCAVPLGFIGDRGPTPGPAQEGDAEDSLKRARVIAELLNAARDYYPFADPEVVK